MLAQFPNAPLWVWLGASLAARLLDGRPGAAAELVAFGAIFTWAWLEVTSGVTPFRRLLGLTVLVFSVWSRVASGPLPEVLLPGGALGLSRV